MAIDSDKDFQAKGKIISINRGKSQGSYCWNKKEIVTLELETIAKTCKVDFPIRTESDIELAPYQAALIGEEVAYAKKYRNTTVARTFDTVEESWAMLVLSGKLAGTNYTDSRLKLK